MSTSLKTRITLRASEALPRNAVALVPILSVPLAGCAWGDPGGSEGRTFIFQDPVFWIVALLVGGGALISKLRGDD